MLEIRYSEIEFFIAIILIVATSIQILYYGLIYSRIALFKHKANTSESKNLPVSIIICAKNEEDNLRKFLPLILEQQYPTFEVILVNDCSEDDTESFITNLQKKYTNLKYTFIKDDPKFKHGKKLAVTLGIKAAQYNHFVFIDADCYPETPQWLQCISSQFNESTYIVLGYGGYEPKTGFLDKLVRYDTFFIALNYLSFARIGLPYMGVGRNMAYSRAAYEQSSKFTKHYHILSGDDDLFVCEVGRRGNTRIELSGQGFTRSEQVETFAQWCSQKRRHLTTASSYRFIHQFLLALEPLTRMLMFSFILIYAILLSTTLLYVVISLVSMRFLLQLIIHNLTMNRLHESKLLVYSPLFDVLLPFLISILMIQNKLNTRKRRWK